MIRSLAALFAKKTAIVAITGVTVIGGATFALADADVIPGITSESTGDPDASETETPTETETETATETVTETATEEGTETSTEEGTETSRESEDAGLDITAAGADDELENELEDETGADADAEDSHGVMVSDAARNICHKPENIAAYGNHGQCVKAFAHGEGVDHSEAADSAPAVAPAAPEPAPIATQSVDAAPKTEPAVQPGPPAGKGKPAHAEGKGNGGGKGKKS